MPAYAIFDLKVFDIEKLKEYKNVAPEILKKFGGKVIISGGEANSVEGNWNQKRVVVIEFPSYEIANDWWNSDEYKKATELRKKAADTSVLIIDGIS
jgi:uncharacterized protein (DUF1330 family)